MLASKVTELPVLIILSAPAFIKGAGVTAILFNVATEPQPAAFCTIKLILKLPAVVYILLKGGTWLPIPFPKFHNQLVMPLTGVAVVKLTDVNAHIALLEIVKGTAAGFGFISGMV